MAENYTTACICPADSTESWKDHRVKNSKEGVKGGIQVCRGSLPVEGESVEDEGGLVGSVIIRSLISAKDKKIMKWNVD